MESMYPVEQDSTEDDVVDATLLAHDDKEFECPKIRQNALHLVARSPRVCSIFSLLSSSQNRVHSIRIRLCRRKASEVWQELVNI